MDPGLRDHIIQTQTQTVETNTNLLLNAVEQEQQYVQHNIQTEVQQQIYTLTDLLVKDLINILPNDTAKIFFLKKRLEDFEVTITGVEFEYKQALEKELNDLKAKHEKI